MKIVCYLVFLIGSLGVGPALWGMIDKTVRSQKDDRIFPIKEVIFFSLYAFAAAWFITHLLG